MTEQEVIDHLWETAPILRVQAVRDHGVERLVTDGEKELGKQLSRLALYFFRGGVAYQRNQVEVGGTHDRN